jgi:hypothetical protein
MESGRPRPGISGPRSGRLQSYFEDFEHSMKKWMPIVLVAMLTGCNEPKHVSGTDFKQEYELRNAQTMVFSEYMGERDGKVFLKRKTMSLVRKDKWNEEVWFTETNDLAPAFLEELMKDATTGRKNGAGAPRLNE